MRAHNLLDVWVGRGRVELAPVVATYASPGPDLEVVAPDSKTARREGSRGLGVVVKGTSLGGAGVERRGCRAAWCGWWCGCAFGLPVRAWRRVWPCGWVGCALVSPGGSTWHVTRSNRDARYDQSNSPLALRVTG